MRPEEKDWWRKKNHENYVKARDGHLEQQRKFNNKGGGGGCLVFIIATSAIAILTIGKLYAVLT